MHREEHCTLAGRRCVFWIPEGPGPFPVVCLCVGEAESLIPALIGTELPPVLFCHADAQWERDFTPWPAAALPGREAFSGGAPAYLAFLRDVLLPYAQLRYPVSRDSAHHAIAGYSLGGLFALWTLCETDLFGAAASLSGSLWYDGWTDYLAAHTLPRDARIYLSLGRSEERAGNPRMAAVGENTRQTYERLSGALRSENVRLEWNRGGHFTGIPNRWRKAMEWLTVPWKCVEWGK